MTYKFTIPIKKKRDGKWDKMPNLNEFIKGERTTIYTKNGKFLTKGAVMKREWQKYISLYICQELKGLKLTNPVIIHYQYYMPDQRSDVGNIHATCQKFTEDALQECGVIQNDNQKFVKGFTADFFVNKDNPHITVELEETEDEDFVKLK